MTQVNAAREARNQQRKICESIPRKRDAYEKSFDERIRQQRGILEEGRSSLSKLRNELLDMQDQVGKPGSAKDAFFAITMLVRETADLISTLGGEFDSDGSKLKEAILKSLEKVRKKVDENRSDKGPSNEQPRWEDILPTFIPGVKMMRDLDNQADARTAIRERLEFLDGQLKKVEDNLRRTDGPLRSDIIDSLLIRGASERRQCEQDAMSIRPH
jgi:hypothetical protein